MEASLKQAFQQRQSNVNGDNEEQNPGSLRCTLDPTELRVVQFVAKVWLTVILPMN